jgi:hypothetical protein
MGFFLSVQLIAVFLHLQYCCLVFSLSFAVAPQVSCSKKFKVVSIRSGQETEIGHPRGDSGVWFYSAMDRVSDLY